MTLDINSQAPGFTAPIQTGETVSLSDYKGQPVVLYFYPKDDTPGCTTEACGFRDQLPDFSSLDAVVLGVSKDSVAKHQKFIDKYDLTFSLISDENTSICEDYGVWVEKSMYGKKYMGIERATFLIDGAGTIQKIWRKVKVPGHVEEVLEALKQLKQDQAA